MTVIKRIFSYDFHVFNNYNRNNKFVYILVFVESVFRISIKCIIIIMTSLFPPTAIITTMTIINTILLSVSSFDMLLLYRLLQS